MISLFLTVISSLVLSGAAATPSAEPLAAETASTLCQIGASPTLHVPRVQGVAGEKLTAKPRVVGCGNAGHGYFEIVAYDTSRAFCFSVDLPRLGVSQGIACQGNKKSKPPLCTGLCILSVTGAGLSDARRSRYTVVGGLAPLATDSVAGHYSLNDEEHKVRGAVARITGTLKRELKQPRTMVLYAVVTPVCVPSSAVTIIASDAAGALLGKTNGKHIPSFPCRHPPLPSLSD